MGTTPLGESVLSFFQCTRARDTGPFDMLPWTNATWRAITGLVPLPAPGSEHDDSTEDSPALEGFRLTPEATQSLRPIDRKYFDSKYQENVVFFLKEMWRRSKQRPSTCLVRKEDVVGFDAYKNTIKAMLNRKGGAMYQAQKVMLQMRRTPAFAWREKWEGKLRGEKKVPESQQKMPPPGRFIGAEMYSLLAERIFGGEAVGRMTRMVLEMFEPPLSCIAQRSWERQSRATWNMLKDGERKEQNFKTAFEDAQTAPTSSNLRKLTNTLKVWRERVEITGEDEDEEFQAAEAHVRTFWETLGWSRGADGEVIRKKKAKAGGLLASEEQMQAAYLHYLETFFPPDADVAASLFHELEDLSEFSEDVLADLAPGDHDLGVEEYKDTPIERVRQLLGFVNDQYPFGEPGTTGEDGQVAKARFVPKWHQLVGNLVALEGMFTEHEGEAPRPTFLCDDVGLGKTPQIVGLIQMIAHIIELQQRGDSLPPALELKKKRFFAGQAKIVSKPFLIVVPRTLAKQWAHEATQYLERGAFNIIVYSRELVDPNALFEEDGLWSRLVTNNAQPHRTLIIAELPSLAREAKECLKMLAFGDKAAVFRGDSREVRAGMEQRTIFTPKFCMVAIDESHTLRNAKDMHYAVLQLMENADVRVAATATPIFNGAKDLFAQGRLLRYGPMIGELGVELGFNMERSERARQRQWNKNKDDIIRNHAARVANSLSDDIGGEEPQAIDEEMAVAVPGGQDQAQAERDVILAAKRATEEDRGIRGLYISRESIKMAKKALMPIVVRRTGRSLQPNGEQVMTLPPLVESIAWTPLRPLEMEAARKLNDLLDQPHDEEMQIKWANFLAEHRGITYHYRLLKGVDIDFISTWTVENVDKESSSKIVQTITLIEHHQDPAAKPMFFHRDGSRDFRKEEQTECTPATRPRKFIVFVLYKTHQQIIKKVFDLKGLTYLEYNGSMSLKARAEAIRKFEETEDEQILLMSNIGTTGLNITRASVAIFLSGMWSGQDINQTLGRLHRPGQIELVVGYHLYASKTVDEVLAGYADSKKMMLDQFLGRRSLANRLLPSSAAQSAPDSDSDSDSEPAPPRITNPRTTRVRARALKVPAATDAESSTTSGPKEVADPPASRKRKSKVETGPASKRAKPADVVAPEVATTQAAKPGRRAPPKAKVVPEPVIHQPFQTSAAEDATPTLSLPTSPPAQSVEPAGDAPVPLKKAPIRPRPRLPPLQPVDSATSLPSDHPPATSSTSRGNAPTVVFEGETQPNVTSKQPAADSSCDMRDPSGLVPAPAKKVGSGKGKQPEKGPPSGTGANTFSRSLSPVSEGPGLGDSERQASKASESESAQAAYEEAMESYINLDMFEDPPSPASLNHSSQSGAQKSTTQAPGVGSEPGLRVPSLGRSSPLPPPFGRQAAGKSQKTTGRPVASTSGQKPPMPLNPQHSLTPSPFSSVRGSTSLSSKKPAPAVGQFKPVQFISKAPMFTKSSKSSAVVSKTLRMTYEDDRAQRGEVQPRTPPGKARRGQDASRLSSPPADSDE